jgi:hypothetical protein
LSSVTSMTFPDLAIWNARSIAEVTNSMALSL